MELGAKLLEPRTEVGRCFRPSSNRKRPLDIIHHHVERTSSQRHPRSRKAQQRSGQVPRHSRCHAQPGGRSWYGQPRVVARQPQPRHPSPARSGLGSNGSGFRLRGGLQEARLQRAEVRPHEVDDRLAGLVARRLGALRRPHDPHGVARGGYLSYGRWSRRCRHRQSAFRAAEQLAGQRQLGQGPPPVVAHQAEVREQHLLGRSHDPRRQRGARIHGLQDLRLRWWPCGHLATRGGHLLGRGDRVARHQ